ncbi:ABC transporter ATP-binding protein [Oceanicola sp. S124]|uniref:ABC transporter ATP-binding protein n=1 Tax=Oceanicola sp. S124 TaxID=1042378 RepID=UPI0002558CE3|nr:ABC transporter ATP-binding protein [Oceanicola sp. S124]
MSVTIRDLRKSFGAHAAVNGISVEIPQGAFFTVLGPSGCGKSTLLRLIAGLELPDAGQIALNQTPVSGPGHHVPPEDRDVGVVFQTYALWPHMDVTGNVAFPLECEGMGRRQAREAAAEHLRTVSLTEFGHRRPAELSGGQRQRVALARCLAGGAGVVLMDEPLANLDPHLRHRMEEELAAFHETSGATVVYITHDQREAMALATQVAVMEDGRFAQVGTPEDLHDRPACEHVARFIGRAAVLPVQIASDSADLGPLRAPLLAGAGRRDGPGKVVIRPAKLRPTDPGSPGTLTATLSRATYRGGTWEALAEVPGLAEPLPLQSPRRLRRGERLGLCVSPLWALPDGGAPAP